MDTDKAYLLGLIIGGGVFGNAEDVFRIKLPYKKWGSYIENPKRAGDISKDILNKVGQMFRAIYGLTIQYETSESGNWVILCEGDTQSVQDELARYGILSEGQIMNNADIGLIVAELHDENLKRRFIAGLADTIGSMAKSHRRFTDEHQILSFEIKGYNYKFVCDLCRLLYSINCIPDQVNWNHPNIHCPSNPYYSQWNKGFKLRILLDQYAKFGAFAFRTKAEAANENRKLQQQVHTAEKCEIREIHVTPSTVHPAENDVRLPENIRGGHYIHFRHFCAVMGCVHAPYEKIYSCFSNLGELICPFPILCKGNREEIERIINSDPLLAKRSYNPMSIRVDALLSISKSEKNALIYGNNSSSGYPISEILQGVAFIIAKDCELAGNRIRGNYIELIEKHLEVNKDLTIQINKPEILTPLCLTYNGRMALIGAKNPNVYARLVSFDERNPYKLLIRKITEEDLQNG